MICARDVSRANIIPEGVIDLEQFITNPRAIKRQLPPKPRMLSASSDFDGPGVLWLKRCVHDGGIRTLSKVDQIILENAFAIPLVKAPGTCVLCFEESSGDTDVSEPVASPVTVTSSVSAALLEVSTACASGI